MSERHVVPIAQLAVVTGGKGRMVTHALGSCIGVTVFDPVARVAGMVHFMLPNKGAQGTRPPVDVGPHAYGATAVPSLFRAAYALGAEKERLIVCAAGGAERSGGEEGLRIGARNWAMLRKLLWKNGVEIAASDIGGTESRNMSLDLVSGAVEITSGGVTRTIHETRKAS